MRRYAVGIIALVLFIGAVAFLFWPPQSAATQQLDAACWRVGALMAVLWLAYPQVKQMPPWLWGTIPALLVILAVKPKWFLVAAPIVLALAILKPRSPSRR